MIVACVIALTTRLHFAIVPAIFFFYGAIGNAIARTWWSIMLGEANVLDLLRQSGIPSAHGS